MNYVRASVGHVHTPLALHFVGGIHSCYDMDLRLIDNVALPMDPLFAQQSVDRAALSI